MVYKPSTNYLDIIIRWRPILAGAFVQAAVMAEITDVIEDLGLILVAAGFVGGLIAGAVTANSADGWVDGGGAGIAGVLVFALVLLVAFPLSNASSGDSALSGIYLWVVTALPLIVFYGPIAAVPGCLGGYLSAETFSLNV
jgi:hypothetical protein